MRAHVAAALLAAAAAWLGEPLLPPLPPAVTERAGVALGSRWNPHRVSAAQFQNAWTPFAPPVLTVASGAVVEVDAARAATRALDPCAAASRRSRAAQLDASGGQLTPDSTAADLAAVDFARASRRCAVLLCCALARTPVFHPVFVVRRAEPRARPGVCRRR